MVLLGGVEAPRRQHLGDDGVLPLLLLLRQRLARLPLLLRRVVVDARPVLRPDVVALVAASGQAIELNRVEIGSSYKLTEITKCLGISTAP